MYEISRKKVREQAVSLRENGKTYKEIQAALGTIPKSTLSFWMRDVSLPKGYQRKIEVYNKLNLKRARGIAWRSLKAKREKYLQALYERNRHLSAALNNKDTAKVALAVLYLGEGSKTRRGSLMFGNSDPFTVSLFLRLLRFCYRVDEKKFRCTVQCRADQDVMALDHFWSALTKIPLSQFYKARIDPRTIGKKSNKTEYKGVCRIDYFSAEVYLEMRQIVRIIHMGPWRSGSASQWH